MRTAERRTKSAEAQDFNVAVGGQRQRFGVEADPCDVRHSQVLLTQHGGGILPVLLGDSQSGDAQSVSINNGDEEKNTTTRECEMAMKVCRMRRASEGRKSEGGRREGAGWVE